MGRISHTKKLHESVLSARQRRVSSAEVWRGLVEELVTELSLTGQMELGQKGTHGTNVFLGRDKSVCIGQIVLNY